jgi:CTP:molybdopterin cytidylyltransferase MocA
VLDVLAAAQLIDTVVVIGHGAERLEAAIAWRSETRVRNPDPDLGLSSSLRIGLDVVRSGEAAGAFVVLGDQPTLRMEVLESLLEAAPRALDQGRPILVPRYEQGGGANPALILRDAWPLVDGITGDRGLGPVIAARPDLVAEVDVAGMNPDVDTPADLAALSRQSSSG